VKSDDLRPRGTVEVECDSPGCTWRFWVGATDPRLPDGPFVCAECAGVGIAEKAK
jgi:hypothetical protein